MLNYLSCLILIYKVKNKRQISMKSKSKNNVLKLKEFQKS